MGMARNTYDEQFSDLLLTEAGEAVLFLLYLLFSWQWYHRGGGLKSRSMVATCLLCKMDADATWQIF